MIDRGRARLGITHRIEVCPVVPGESSRCNPVSGRFLLIAHAWVDPPREASVSVTFLRLRTSRA